MSVGFMRNWLTLELTVDKLVLLEHAVVFDAAIIVASSNL